MLSILFFTLIFISIHHAECKGSLFVQRDGQNFTYAGRHLRFGGANNYYIPFAPKPQVDDVFDMARKMGMEVIRTWAFNLIGNPEGGSSFPPTAQTHLDTYFHYWNTSTWSSDFNEGPNGLIKLDYAVQKASESGIKLILVLSNNWADYGGLEQMNLWHQLKHHDDFFTDLRTRTEYKKWVYYLLNRINRFTGLAYKDEPAIFAWQLMNEPRCQGCKDVGNCVFCEECQPANTGCRSNTIVEWASVMAKYIKRIDRNHLVAVGDEGFLNMKGGWGYDGMDGDYEALAKIDELDFLTFHAYPAAWGQTMDWASDWIDVHLNIAKQYNKPSIFEEFGVRDLSGELGLQENRNYLYDQWTKQTCKADGQWMVWMIAAREVKSDSATIDGKPLYPDYDEYTVYYETANGTVTPSGRKMKDRVSYIKTGVC